MRTLLRCDKQQVRREGRKAAWPEGSQTAVQLREASVLEVPWLLRQRHLRGWLGAVWRAWSWHQSLVEAQGAIAGGWWPTTQHIPEADTSCCLPSLSSGLQQFSFCCNSHPRMCKVTHPFPFI